MSKAQEIFNAAFATPRDPRSAEYKQGVLDVLKYRLGEANVVGWKMRYTLGTAQADAYFAGCDEGHRRAREYLEKVGDGRTAKMLDDAAINNLCKKQFTLSIAQFVKNVETEVLRRNGLSRP
jgi:hypothetical protein